MTDYSMSAGNGRTYRHKAASFEPATGASDNAGARQPALFTSNRPSPAVPRPPPQVPEFKGRSAALPLWLRPVVLQLEVWRRHRVTVSRRARPARVADSCERQDNSDQRWLLQRYAGRAALRPIRAQPCHAPPDASEATAAEFHQNRPRGGRKCSGPAGGGRGRNHLDPVPDASVHAAPVARKRR
eukprot:5794329-Prymnesium_polylepis.1